MPTVSFTMIEKTQVNGAGSNASVNLNFEEVPPINGARRSTGLGLRYAGNDSDFAAASALAINAPATFTW